MVFRHLRAALLVRTRQLLRRWSRSAVAFRLHRTRALLATTARCLRLQVWIWSAHAANFPIRLYTPTPTHALMHAEVYVFLVCRHTQPHKHIH